MERLKCDVQYFQRVVKNISLISGLELVQAYDLIDATQNLDGYCACSGITKSCAVNLSKMSNAPAPYVFWSKNRTW